MARRSFREDESRPLPAARATSGSHRLRSSNHRDDIYLGFVDSDVLIHRLLFLKIFRYYKAEHGVSVLNDLEIRTSIPSELNDPFELSPNIDPSQFSQRRIEALLRQNFYVDKAYHEEGRRRGLTSKKEFKRLYLRDVPRRAAEALPKIPKNVEAVRRGFAERFGKYWRLVCASLVNDSVLMWSHYAANHTGVAVAFDTKQKPFCQISDDCWLTVRYSNKKPDYIYSHKDREFRKKMFAVAGTKASSWSYEKEIRIVLADTAIRDRRLLPLTPKSIAAVYCGCRISAADKKAVGAALSAPHFKHVELCLATLDESEYALKFEESVI